MAVNPLLIALGHKARVGKDTLAWMLIDQLRPQGVDTRRYGFADALKAVCRVEHGMRGKDARLLQEVGVSYRDGWRKGMNMSKLLKMPTPTPAVWIDAAHDAIREDAPDVAIIPDCRFPNELEFIRAHNGLFVRIERPAPPDTGRDNTHISETALDGVEPDYTIVNDGTLTDLRAAAVPLARLILTRLSRRGA